MQRRVVISQGPWISLPALPGPSDAAGAGSGHPPLQPGWAARKAGNEKL